MRLNFQKPFGKISPPYQPDGFDRAAYYEQDAQFFDAHGRQIIPGKPLSAEEAAKTPAEINDSEDLLGVSELIAKIDRMSFTKFKNRAKKILGDTCPNDREGIVAALKEALAKVQAREAARRKVEQKASEPAPAAGLSWSAVSGDDGTGINLAAWAAGKKDYLFSEVQKEIRTKHNKQISERRDAVDFVVELGLVESKDARTDFI